MHVIAGKFKGKVSDSEISLDDLSELLHSVDHDKFVNSDGKVISDKALCALLDRSFTNKREERNAPDPTNGERVETSDPEPSEQAGVFKVLEEIGNVVCTKKGADDNMETKNETEESPCSVEAPIGSKTEEKMECDENTDDLSSTPDNMEIEGRSAEQITVSASS